MKKTINTNAKKIFIVIMFFILIITLFAIINKLMIKILYQKKYEEYVSKYSKEYQIDEELIYALIKVESHFKPNAISTSNAKGLMQLMYSTAKEVANKIGIEITEENILTPEINIQIGTKYISDLLDKYNNIELALAAYNAGSGNVDKWIKNGIIKSDGSDAENIPFKETNIYVRKIIRDYKIYKSYI